MNISLSGCHHY